MLNPAVWEVSARMSARLVVDVGVALVPQRGFTVADDRARIVDLVHLHAVRVVSELATSQRRGPRGPALLTALVCGKQPVELLLADPCFSVLVDAQAGDELAVIPPCILQG